MSTGQCGDAHFVVLVLRVVRQEGSGVQGEAGYTVPVFSKKYIYFGDRSVVALGDLEFCIDQCWD